MKKTESIWFIYTATCQGKEKSFQAAGPKMAFRLAISEFKKLRPIKIRNDETGETNYILE